MVGRGKVTQTQTKLFRVDFNELLFILTALKLIKMQLHKLLQETDFPRILNADRPRNLDEFSLNPNNPTV